MTERGSVSIVAVAVISTLVVLSAGLVATGRVFAARVQATAAADAAALAAAPLTWLPGDPASEAASFAAANGARLIACACPVDPRPVARTVTVTVALDVALPLFGTRRVGAKAAAEFDPWIMLGG